ncbi:MAG: mechanosensitive ion channel [Candidatus Gracilibacteria bacterium]|nr:mechanosensitive ion channel [Candidatus Gracilibacteria bacterium]
MLKKIFFSLALFVFIISGYLYFKDMVHFNGIKPYYLDNAMIIIGAIIITYAVTVIVDFIFLKIFGKVVKGDSLGKKILPLLHNISTIVVWVIGILFTINLLGINISAFLTGAGIGGVILALAGKEAFTNLFGSLTLVFSKNFKIGDSIRIKGYEGNVSEITLSNTKLIDKKGNFVYIPNKFVISEIVENLSQQKFKRIELKMNITGTSKLDSIRKSMEKIVKNLEKNRFIEETVLNLDIDNGLILNASLKISAEGDLPKNKTEIISLMKDEFEKEGIEFGMNR